jgi:hypothetical protein
MQVTFLTSGASLKGKNYAQVSQYDGTQKASYNLKLAARILISV